MGINKILPFAQGVGANVLSDVDYAALTTLLANGFQSGTALSVQLNKVWRQSSSMAVGLAEFIASNQAQNVSDNLSAATIAGLLEDAIVAFSAGNFAALAGSASQAFSAATPEQFDNDSSAATTEFVQRALGNIRGSLTWTTGTLTAADCGKFISCGTGATTLPLLSACPDGAAFYFLNSGGGNQVISRQGADSISPDGTLLTSITMAPGDDLLLTKKTGGDYWMALYGSARLKYSTLFGSSLAASGYQKLPSGLIIQWGYITISAPSAAVTFPISFPNICQAVLATPNNSSSTFLIGGGARTTSGTTLYIDSGGPFGVVWQAIGY